MADRIESLSGRFDDASSILLLAPSAGARDDAACIDLLTTGDETDRDVLSITVSETPEARLALWQRTVGDRLPERAAVLAAPTSTEGRPAGSNVSETPVTVTTLADPVDPLEFVSAVSVYLGRWDETPERTFVCVHSVTALLEKLHPREVVRVISVLNARLDAMDAVAHYHLDPTDHDERALAEIRALFDVVIEAGPDGTWNVTRSEDGAASSRNGTAVPPSLSHSFDAVLDILGAPQRRAVLYYLSSIDSERVSLDTLVSEVRAVAPAVGETDWDDSAHSLEISLFHVHLPKLEAAGVIDLDREEMAIQYYPNPALEASIEEARRIEHV